MFVILSSRFVILLIKTDLTSDATLHVYNFGSNIIRLKFLVVRAEWIMHWAKFIFLQTFICPKTWVLCGSKLFSVLNIELKKNNETLLSLLPKAFLSKYSASAFF